MAGRGTRERALPTKWQRFKNALYSNQNFEYLYWLQVIGGFCFDWTLRLLGPVLLLLATGLISGVVAVYFMFILPKTAEVGSIAYVLHATWAMFLASNVFFNYFHCAFTHPGKPASFLPRACQSDSDCEATSEEEETGVRHLMAGAAGISRVNVGGSSEGSGEGARAINRGVMSAGTRGAGGGGIRLQAGFCKKCREAKPARAHHCHVCNQCIVNMDHHCPWMNNCVGYLNYRYFVLFLMYMFVGCLYGVLVTAPHFLSLAKTTGTTRHIRGANDMNEHSAVMMTFVLSLSVGIAILVLLGWHIYLILTAQTTIDFYQNQANRSKARQWGELWTNPFDVGYKANWQQVFGTRPFLLSLLPSRRAPPPPVVEFFPLEPQEGRRPLMDEGEWTADTHASAGYIV